jgi:ribose transport system permease protein
VRTFVTLIAFLVIVAVFWWQRPTTFMTVGNWLNITQQVSILGVMAFTMTVVMVVGDYDLSVGTMASLVGIVIGMLFQNGQSIPLAIAAALIMGTLGGLQRRAGLLRRDFALCGDPGHADDFRWAGAAH